MSILSTKNLTKIYGTGENAVHALSDVSIDIEEGSFVSIIGSSGSGKSTLLNMLGGLDRATDGTVIVDGQKIFEMSDEELTIFRRRKIGFVSCLVLILTMHMLQKTEDAYFSAIVSDIAELIDVLTELEEQEIFPANEDTLLSKLQSKIRKLVRMLKLQNEKEQMDGRGVA